MRYARGEPWPPVMIRIGRPSRPGSDAGFELASPMALAVTDRRLLSLKISSPIGLGIGGDVKELVSAAPLGEVDSIEAKRLAVGKTVTVTVRGTPFTLEVGAGANVDGVVEAFSSRTPG